MMVVFLIRASPKDRKHRKKTLKRFKDMKLKIIAKSVTL